MAKRWTISEELLKRKELDKFYIKENRSIGEIAKILNLGQSTIYGRLLRLSIKPMRSRKMRFNNKRGDISIPEGYSEQLSEFIGVLLGDGHLTPTQVTVTLGNKEVVYVSYLTKLIKKLFNIEPKTIRVRNGYHVVYVGSTYVVRWLLSMGLVFNKVKSQVDLPPWIFSNKDYVKGFLRGFFDTDGSIYKLRFGVQLAFINRSLPMLESLRSCLSLLDYSPSNISQFRIYLTRREDIIRFFKTVNPANAKHQKRFQMFLS
ncbi:hypothetical protein A2115_00695 [Candidatus Woesebacteria bacterium GWA1_41_8]|uniref:DOD-type homing endonuclease domain-containing protein n=1 Tax=Candidatus Woesebacteria bacterium GWA1_41_8 TaxID=1802471 RepID=A0A1F7WI38_9BACT|nr:MAG: hypothetical protein A2115_00695 [Candidatus Woesebacteria bacterium GWA1_41_8]